MTIVDYRTDEALYAEIYSRLDITGTYFLAFRDLPELMTEFRCGSKTLDYGCGGGKSTVYLKSLGKDVVGVDINEGMIDAAKLYDPEGKYLLIDKDRPMPFQDSTYDFVFSSCVFMEVPSRNNLLAIAKEVNRVLKDNGIFIFTVCHELAYGADWLTSNTEFEENKFPRSGEKVKVRFKDIDLVITDYFWSDEDYREMIGNAGLRLLRIHTPLGKGSDGYSWINEHKRPLFNIYVCQK